VLDAHSRRSRRVILSISVAVSNEGPRATGDFEEQTRTLVVNAHGALLALTASVEMGEALRLKNPMTRQETVCKVAYVGAPQQGQSQIGVEFTTASPDFWAINFPPEDRKPGPRPADATA